MDTNLLILSLVIVLYLVFYFIAKNTLLFKNQIYDYITIILGALISGYFINEAIKTKDNFLFILIGLFLIGLIFKIIRYFKKFHVR